MQFPDQRFSAVYIIYDADVRAYSETFIEDMSPASHLPAGFPDGSLRKRVREIVASRFDQTEGNEQYDFGYLGKHGGSPRYFPYGTIDADGTPPPDYEAEPDAPDYELGEGQHRKWVAELSRAEWLIFADAYLIELDDAGYPVEYEETMGAMTEHGHLEAVSVRNREGWDNYHGQVIDSDMYVSFGYPEDPNPGLRDVDAGSYEIGDEQAGPDSTVYRS